jgi:hypothetical protein
VATHEQVINKFYEGFRARDAEAMCSCYHPDIEFSDAVFRNLKGTKATGMWSMLCARAEDLAVTFGEVRADGTHGSAHWEAIYTFSGTGRRVHNVIEASFEFSDGLIIRHVDRFSFWKWSGMALGPAGLFLGWTPLLRAAVRRRARHGLDAFLAGFRPEGTPAAPRHR